MRREKREVAVESHRQRGNRQTRGSASTEQVGMKGGGARTGVDGVSEAGWGGMAERVDGYGDGDWRGPERSLDGADDGDCDGVR